MTHAPCLRISEYKGTSDLHSSAGHKPDKDVMPTTYNTPTIPPNKKRVSILVFWVFFLSSHRGFYSVLQSSLTVKMKSNYKCCFTQRKDNRTVGILLTHLRQVEPLYALFQVDHSLCGREWTRTKQLSGALSSHPVPPPAHIPHSRL